jgi:cystathionine beta-lyase
VSKLKLDNPFEHFLSHGVALSDGTGMGDKDYLRLNFACTRATLEQILERMQQAVAACSKKGSVKRGQSPFTLD